MTAVGAREEGSERASPPSLLLMLAEGRAFGEFGASFAFAPLLMSAPRGDGHPVLVLPGFMASDMSTPEIGRAHV